MPILLKFLVFPVTVCDIDALVDAGWIEIHKFSIIICSNYLHPITVLNI